MSGAPASSTTRSSSHQRSGRTSGQNRRTTCRMVIAGAAPTNGAASGVGPEQRHQPLERAAGAGPQARPLGVVTASSAVRVAAGAGVCVPVPVPVLVLVPCECAARPWRPPCRGDRSREPAGAP